MTVDAGALVAAGGILAQMLVYSYAGYWSLAIRSGLAVPVYRNQALGSFVIVIVASFTSLYVFAGFFVSNFGNGIEGVVSVTVISLGLFYWVDASMLAARRSDPLMRDLLHWRSARKVLWAFNIVVLSYLLLLDVISPFYTYGGPLVITPFLIAVICGALLLTIVARRTAAPALRQNLRWFGLFFLSTLITYPFSAGGGPFAGVPAELILVGLGIFGGYCLLRSVRSLVEVSEDENLRAVAGVASTVTRGPSSQRDA